MVDFDISRRDVLADISAGGVGALAVGMGVVGAVNADRHIVGTSTPAATTTAKRTAESVHRILDFGDIGQAVAGQFSDAALDTLRKNPNVRYIEVDGQLEAIDQTLPWGIDRVDAEVAHATDSDQDSDGETETGDGAHIAIIDTGIDGDHPDLDANVGAGKAFVECGSRSCTGRPCFDTTNCNHSWSDDNDHGTHVAGIADAEDNSEGVVGVSTEATLHAVKVLDCNGCGSFSDVAAGIKHVADQGWDVGNLSLGGSHSSTVEDAVEYASEKGVLLVAAAGNDGPCTDCVSHPAAEPEVIAVSATNKDDCLADFSSQGPEVELAAPGTDITSTAIDGYDTFSGTSMASPHVAGTGGQLMANGFTNTEARDQMNTTAEDVGLSSNEQGNGLVDTAAALGLDSSDSTGQCGDGGSGGDNPPSASIDSVSETETPSPHAEFDVSWSASDEDGDLDTAELTLSDDTDAETEDSETIDISGDSASGTTTLQAKHDDGSGNDYTATLVVTDSNGNTAEDSLSFSENQQ